MSHTSDSDKLLMPISEQDHSQGAVDASVVLVAYGDYQCLSCCEVYRMIQTIQRKVQLRFVFRHFPRTSIHSQAQQAAEASEAAAAQDQFWQMHDTLFDHQSMLSSGYLLEYANQIQLNINQFLQEMTDHVHTERVAKHIQGAIQSGVSSAPALFINGVRYRDAWESERLLLSILQSNSLSVPSQNSQSI